jgi:hypothetical protein
VWRQLSQSSYRSLMLHHITHVCISHQAVFASVFLTVVASVSTTGPVVQEDFPNVNSRPDEFAEYVGALFLFTCTLYLCLNNINLILYNTAATYFRIIEFSSDFCESTMVTDDIKMEWYYTGDWSWTGDDNCNFISSNATENFAWLGTYDAASYRKFPILIQIYLSSSSLFFLKFFFFFGCLEWENYNALLQLQWDSNSLAGDRGIYARMSATNFKLTKYNGYLCRISE